MKDNLFVYKYLIYSEFSKDNKPGEALFFNVIYRTLWCHNLGPIMEKA